MKALVLEEYNRLEYKDMPDPELSDVDVLVKVEACGICGSDVHGMDGSSGRRVPPVIMGHEASGVIVEVGSGVHGWKSGDRVTFDSTVYPLDDWYSLNGHYNLSDGRQVLGVSPGDYKRHGAFAEYVSIPQHILHRIPDAVTFEQAAMVEPIAVALHAVNLSGVKLGDSCAVVGVGTIGVFILQLLKVSGISDVVAIDLSEANRARALKMGASNVFDPSEDCLVETVKRLANGRGIDVVFEAVGINPTVNLAIDLLRKGGTGMLVGNLAPTVELPLQKVVTQELKLLGSCGIRGEYPAVLDLLESGKIPVDDHIAAVAPLSEGAEWFDKLYKNEVSGKVILKP